MLQNSNTDIQAALEQTFSQYDSKEDHMFQEVKPEGKDRKKSQFAPQSTTPK